MYNIANHYENIYQYLNTIIADARVLYLHPFGATQPENIEIIRDDRDPPDRRGPLFIFYDQEPLHSVYNQNLFTHIKLNTTGPHILVNTEQTSVEKDLICQQFNLLDVNYFFHVFAAADWYRGHKFLPGVVAPQNRTLRKTYISFNRLTSNERVYRSLFISELYKADLLQSGHVSYSRDCPEGGAYDKNLFHSIANQNIPADIATEAIKNIHRIPELRIDFEDCAHIPNQSMLLSPLPQLMESFVFVVTETCYWQTKTHLTEKIFKPIVLRMPFILLGCAHNLAYLRSYGFKTFGDYWDESYDAIEDPIARMQAVTKILSELEGQDLQAMLLDMQPILDHNYHLFNNPNFLHQEWQHLKTALREVCQLL
jgi:hypothetical protein